MKLSKTLLSGLTVASLLTPALACNQGTAEKQTTVAPPALSHNHDDGCGEGACGSDDDKKDEKKDDHSGE